MQITLNGIAFESSPSGLALDLSADQTRIGKALSNQHIYTWNCQTRKVERRPNLNAKGELTLPVFATVHESGQNGFPNDIDTTKTALMKVRLLAATKLRGVSDLGAAVRRSMGPHRVKIDLGPFNWLKPLVSFEIWLETDFHFFEFTNQVQNLRFYVGLPHRARLAPRITAVCNAEQMLDALTDGRDLNAEDAGLSYPGTKQSRKGRRGHLGMELRPFGFGLLEGVDGETHLSEETRKRRKKHRDDIKTLEQFEENGGNPPGD